MTQFDITPAVQRALQVAQQWARCQQSPHLQSAHLLQGLLHDEEGRAWLLLDQAGLDPQRIRLQLPSATQEDCDADGPGLSRAVRGAMSRAHDLARGNGEELSITTDHLLFAMLEHDASLRQSLEAEGLKFEVLEAAVVVPEGPPIQLDEPLRLEETQDMTTAARIVDASANRAREALRVLEDYCRFVLNDGFLSAELKNLRHDLAAALSVLPANWLVQARDTLGDVGVDITTTAEMQRGDLFAVLQASCKRLQEALRSLEEYGKLLSTDLAARVETLRYRAYALEGALLPATSSRTGLDAAELCVLVSSELCRASLVGTVREAAAGGAKVIQLREKRLDDRALLALALDLRELTRKLGVLFILNDRPDLAVLAQADGVHLGQEDMPIRQARRILGPDAIIGVSTHDLEQLRQAVLDGANYVGVGPVFPSNTKNFDGLAGLDFVRQAAVEISLPAFAIGGISINNVDEVVAAGATRVAVSEAVCQAANPAAAAANILAQLRRANNTADKHWTA